MAESDELNRLRAENARLKAMLAQHGIAVEEQSKQLPKLSLEEKVARFRIATPEFANALIDASGL